MTTTRLGTMLVASCLASAAIMFVPTANADVAERVQGDIDYCINPGEPIPNNPDCVEPPTPSNDYRGEPVSVHDVKRVDPFLVRASMNVINNDAIQRNSKKPFRIEITGRNPEQTGVRNWIQGNKIWFETMPGRHNGVLPSQASVLYRVIDFKGRKSEEVFAQMVSRAKGCQAAGLC